MQSVCGLPGNIEGEEQFRPLIVASAAAIEFAPGLAGEVKEALDVRARRTAEFLQKFRTRDASQRGVSNISLPSGQSGARSCACCHDVATVGVELFGHLHRIV